MLTLLTPFVARAVRSALSALVLERSAERIRSEARTVLGEIHRPDFFPAVEVVGPH